MHTLSFKAHLIRSIYEYCTDHSLVPMVTVLESEEEFLASYAKDGFVTLNLGNDSVRELLITDDELSFKTRFQGKVTNVTLNIQKIAWMGSSCNSCGMSFNYQNAKAVENEKLTKAKTKQDQPNLRLL